jgi:hypothetical protein
MPLHPNVRRCTHIQITGHRCGSPALKQEYFCYFHTRMIKGVQTRVDSQIHPIALVESAEAIQAAIMHTIDAVLKGTMDNKRANIVLKALYIAVRNSRNVYFHLRQDEMVRQVPNYAQQYLIEHPEPNSPEPRGDSRLGCPPSEAGSPSSAGAPAREAAPKAVIQNEAQAPPKAAQPSTSREATAEPATTTAAERRQNTAHGASPGNKTEKPPAPAERKTAFNPPVQSEPAQHPPKATVDNTPPLTSRQSQPWHEIKKLEACIDGAMRGNWRDLRTVFNAAGLTPFKPPVKKSAERIAPQPNRHSESEERSHPQANRHSESEEKSHPQANCHSESEEKSHPQTNCHSDRSEESAVRLEAGKCNVR